MPKIPSQQKFSPESKSEYELFAINAFKMIADRTGLSERTIRNAYCRKPITYQTALLICRSENLIPACFNIKPDNRGRRRRKYKLVPID